MGRLAIALRMERMGNAEEQEGKDSDGDVELEMPYETRDFPRNPAERATYAGFVRQSQKRQKSPKQPSSLSSNEMSEKRRKMEKT